MPRALVPFVLAQAGLDSDKKVNAVTKEERLRLVDTVKKLCFDLAGPAAIDGAVVTAGGVDVNEIDPKTMESKLTKGLYFAGEVMNVDALTGGYNLQIAWSTGYRACASAGER